jgi:Ni/Fe-hydrogenase subunit HybB-like protein
MLDIGLPHRIWHPILMWNGRSFLFEVAWCVMLYFTVTIVELSPTVLEQLRLRRAAGFLHDIAPGVVLVGIALSSLHHSSLGSLFLVTPQRLHALWYSEWIPVHFILSAMGAGMMAVVLVKILYARSYDPDSIFGRAAFAPKGSAAATCAMETREAEGTRGTGPDFPMVRRLAVVAAGVLGCYLAIKIADLVASGGWRHLLAGTWESWLYAMELAVAALLPLLLVALPRTGRTPGGLLAAATCAVAGLIWNRLDVGIFGYFRDAGVVYFPSLVEWAVSLGVVAAAILVFLYAVENLPIFDAMWRRRQEARRRFVPAFDRVSRVWYTALGRRLDRVSLIAVFAVALAWILMYPPYRDDFRRPSTTAQPPLALDAERAVLRLDANRSALAAEFPHREHQQRLGKQSSCGHCHHLSAPSDHATPCSRCHRNTERVTDIFRHAAHLTAVAEDDGLRGLHPANHSCASCHTPGLTMSVHSAKSCLSCHSRDMSPSRPPDGPFAMRRASGYRVAMHDTCIACHERERERLERPALADCSTCHRELRYREPTAEERERVARYQGHREEESESSSVAKLDMAD